MLSFVDSKDQVIDRRYDDYFKPLTSLQLAESFPDEVPLARKRLRELYSRLSYYSDATTKLMQSSLPDDDKYMGMIVIKFKLSIDPDLKEAKLMENYIKLSPRKTPSYEVEELHAPKETLNVDKARQFPIHELFNPEHVKETSKTISCCCPVHHDKTPSFIIYKEQNKCHCFGCGFNGDVIDLYMKINNVDFQSAVRRLT